MDVMPHRPFLLKGESDSRVLKKSKCGYLELRGNLTGVKKGSRKSSLFLEKRYDLIVVAGKGKRDDTSQSNRTGKSSSSTPFSVLKGAQFGPDVANSHSAVKSRSSSKRAVKENGNKKALPKSPNTNTNGSIKANAVSTSNVSTNGATPHKQANEPPRIVSKLNATLQMLKNFKEAEQKSKIVQTTSYRKKKADKPGASLSSSSSVVDSYIAGDKDVGFESGQGEAVLLVDGYNICGYWPRLNHYFSKGDLQTARDRLLVDLAMYGSVRGVRVVAAFDASNTGRPTCREFQQGIEVIFTVGEADSWIEKEVGLLRANGCPRVWVASSDRAIGDYCSGKGAVVWSAGYLVSEIKTARKDLEEELENMDKDKYSFRGKLLEYGLDADTLASLQRLRMELSSTDRK